MSSRVLHLTTALPPLICGVGDYSLILAKGLRARGIDGRFLVGRWPPPELPDEVEGFPVSVLREHTGDALCRALEAAAAETVLLQFSGYAYAARGLCFWLPEGLARWKARDPRRRLVTMFHELYAMGPPWRTSFWTSPPQRAIARHLALLSDRTVCGYELNARRIRAWTGRPVIVMPVFSNIGELTDPSPIYQREPVAVVFGSEGWRARVWARIDRASEWLRYLEIGSIIDVGASRATMPRFRDLEVHSLGQLAAEPISRAMAQARIALTCYPDHRLAGSGTLAAAFAHGLLVVNLADPGRVYDDLRYGHELMRAATAPEPEMVDAVSGHSWYSKHDQLRTVECFAGLVML